MHHLFRGVDRPGWVGSATQVEVAAIRGRSARAALKAWPI